MTRRKGKTYIGLTYRCGPKRCGIKAVRDRIGCTQSQISARILDRSIWQALSALLVTPELLDQAMNDYCADTDLELTHSQVRFIEQQIARYQQEDERLYRAYIQGAFDEQEFADRRRGGRVAVAALRAEEKALVAQIVSREEFAGRRRQMIRDLVAELRSDPGAPDLPLGTKRRIARMMVDDIQLNVNEGWFKASGTLRGTFSIRTGESIVGCDPST